MSNNQSKILLTILPIISLVGLMMVMAIVIPSVTDAEKRFQRWHWPRSISSSSVSTSLAPKTNSPSASRVNNSTPTQTPPQSPVAPPLPLSDPIPAPTSTSTKVPAPATSPTPVPVVLPVPTTVNIPFISNLVGYWKLDGNTNSALGKDDGRTIGNVTFVPGRFGLAAHFDGKGSYIEIPDQDYFSPSSFGQRTTVSFWFRPDTYNFKGVNQGYVNFLGKSDFSTGSEWEFRVDNETAYDGFPRPERMNFYAFNKSAGLGAGSAINYACPLNTWTNVVGVIDGSNTKLYINGKLVDQDPLSGYNIKMSNTSTPLRIGTSDKEAFLQGSISNVMIYNRNLSDSEVAQLYNTNLK